MAKKQMQAPQGMAGLVRYFEEEKSLIKLKPEHVLMMGILLIVMEIMLFVILPLG